MANTLTAIIPSVIAAMQSVSRSSGALFNAVNKDIDAEAVGLGQAITLPISATASTYTVTPGSTPPALVDSVVTSNTLTLDQHKGSRFSLTEEDLAKIANNPDFVNRQIAQSIKAVVNEASSFLYGKMSAGASLAFGAAGTTPFADSPDLLMDIWADLMDEEAPNEDLKATLSTGAWASAGKLTEFQKLNEAPEGVSFARNSIGMLANFGVSFDQKIASVTKGTGASYVADGGASIGDTVITLKTGTGTVLAGDVVVFAGDSNQYVVKTGAVAAGDIVLAEGLKIALDNGDAMTIQASSVRNICNHMDAVRFGFRPSKASGLDSAMDSTVVVDPVSGLALRLAAYGGYHAGSYEVSAVYGATVDRPEWVKILLG